MVVMKLDPIYYNLIKDGKKIYETRVYDKKRQEIHLLEEIIFINKDTEETFKAGVTELSYFNNFRSAIEEVGVKKVMPNARSLTEAVELYESFKHGSGVTYKKAAENFGVIRIKIEI